MQLGVYMAKRDDFTLSTIRFLAERVGYRCSNPQCGVETAGAKAGCDLKVAKIGVAAHITAAAPGGPRYNAELTVDQRRHASNGIWLCQTCSVLIDRDDNNYTVESINLWKRQAESDANARLGQNSFNANEALLHQAESLRIQKFIQFIYDLFYELELGNGSLSADVYYVDKQVFLRVLNIEEHNQLYHQELLSYDATVRNTQEQIMETINVLKLFFQSRTYIELGNSYKLVEDLPYCYSQEMQNSVELMNSKLLNLASLVHNLHRFRERR